MVYNSKTKIFLRLKTRSTPHEILIIRLKLPFVPLIANLRECPS